MYPKQDQYRRVGSGFDHHSFPPPTAVTEVALNVNAQEEKNTRAVTTVDLDRMQPTSLVEHAVTGPPRSRAPEFYGFVAWSSTSMLFVVYVLWALLPDEYLHWLGVTWYPSREWSLLLPAYSIVLVLLTYFAYLSLAVAHTPSFNDVSAIMDLQGHLPGLVAPNPYVRHADKSIVPELYDIPIGIVNRVLYGPKLKVIQRRSR